MTTLFDTPPDWFHLADSLGEGIDRTANVRPDDPTNALRAAARIRAGRKAACGTVYGYLHEQWPNPVTGTMIVSRFLGTMRDPERRLRELREAMAEAGLVWRIVNVDGTWSIVDWTETR